MGTQRLDFAEFYRESKDACLQAEQVRQTRVAQSNSREPVRPAGDKAIRFPPGGQEVSAGGLGPGLARVDAGEEDPRCARCGGILRSATVMFGQWLDPVVFVRAERAALGCDLFLAIGTTLSVELAASLCGPPARAPRW